MSATGKAALLVALTLLSVVVLASVASATRQNTVLSEYLILVVASDFDDVIWARSIAHNLYNIGIRVDMSILYLSHDYSSASTERAKLKDLGFLWRYDAVLIPDLNKLYTYGGRLQQEEIRALIRYVQGGHVLFMGMNTIVQNWHPLLEEVAGARVVGIVSDMTDKSLYDIVYGGKVFSCNDTFGIVRLEPSGCRVIATFETTDPAITINSYGRGVVIVTAFNPVKAVLNQPNGKEMAELMARVIAESLVRASPGPLPASYKVHEILMSMASKPLRILEELADRAGGGLLGATVVATLVVFTAYLVLLIASILCIVPRRARLVIVKPIARYIPLNSLDSHIIEMIRDKGLLTPHEISLKTGIHPRRLCWRLTLLEAKKHIASIPVPEGIAYVHVEDLPMASLAANPLFNKIASLVLREPGITVHEIAARLSIPPDTALKACKELAAHGVIELRKVLIEYEAYPAYPLYNKLYRGRTTQTARHYKQSQLLLTKHEKPHLAPAIRTTRQARNVSGSVFKGLTRLSTSIASSLASLAASIRDHVHDIVFLVVVVIPVTYLFMIDYLAPGYPASRAGDIYGHLFKVWKLCTSGYHSWIHEWHAGHPFLRFYPPLSYFLACGFAKLPGLDYIAGVKLVMASSLIIAAVTMRLTLGLLGVTPLVAWLAGLMYSFTVWHLRNIAPEGNMPMALGYSLAPLAIYALVACHQQRPRLSRLLFAGLGIGLLILTHHTSTVFTMVSLVPVALTLILKDVLTSENRLRTLTRIVLAYVIVVFVGFAVAAPWLVPFLKEAPKYMNAGSVHDPVLFDFWSVEPSALYTREYGYTEYQGYVMLALPAIGLVASMVYARSRGLRGAILPIAVGISALVALALSMGKYTPLAVLYTEIPYFDRLPPIRFLPIFNLFAVISFVIAMQYIAESSRRSNMVYALVIIVTVIAIIDAFPQTSFLKIEQPDHRYVEAMAYLRNVDKVFRVYQPGLSSIIGSLSSFGPVLSGKDILGGWYREADPTLSQLATLNSATMSGCSIGCEKAKILVEKLCLMYVLSDKRHPAFESIGRGLRRLGYSKVAEFGYIEIYKLNNSCSYVGIAGPRILAIGAYASNIPSLVPGALVDTYNGYLDDLDSEDLVQYDIVVLYGFRYHSRADAIALVKQYLTSGGVVVIDTWGSSEIDSQDVLGLGVSSKIVSLRGILRFTVSRANIAHVPKSWNTSYSYGDGNWTAALHEGVFDEVLLEANGTPVVTLKRVGNGVAVFVSLNMFYHAVYSGSDEEKAFFEALFRSLYSPPEVAVSGLKLGDGRISFHAESDSPVWLWVSQAWYPHWRAYVNGKPAPVEKDPVANIILVYVPAGGGLVELRFEDPYAWLWRAEPLLFLGSIVLAYVLYLMLLKRLSS